MYLFGFRRLKIEPCDLSSVTSYLLRASVPSVISNDGSITVRERDFEKTKEILQGRIEFTYSEPLGLYGFWKRLHHKCAIVISLIFSLSLVVFLSQLVWDIRVDGNEIITDKQVIESLRECGFEIGDIWFTRNKGKIEAAYLSSNENVSWININRRGTVAYVKLMEKKVSEEREEAPTLKYANIIATADCVIEEITVKRGTPLVKVGDVVKKGDILVLGALPEHSGGGFCAAEATVIGRVNDTVSVKIDRKEEKQSYTRGKLSKFSVNIFKISLNIFKRYGNLTKECDIIEDEITYSLFAKYKLPLSIHRTYLVESVREEIEYTDEELVSLAAERLNALTVSRLSSSDLLRIKTYGEFCIDGYIMTSEIVFLSDVGALCEFEIE